MSGSARDLAAARLPELAGRAAHLLGLGPAEGRDDLLKTLASVLDVDARREVRAEETPLRSLAGALRDRISAAGDGPEAGRAAADAAVWTSFQHLLSPGRIGAPGALLLADLLAGHRSAEPRLAGMRRLALARIWVQLALAGETDAVLGRLAAMAASARALGDAGLLEGVLRAAVTLAGFPAIGTAEARRLAALAGALPAGSEGGALPAVRAELAATLVGRPDLGLGPEDLGRGGPEMAEAEIARLDRELAGVLAERVAKAAAARDEAGLRQLLAHLRTLVRRTDSRVAADALRLGAAALPEGDALRTGVEREVAAITARDPMHSAAADLGTPDLRPYREAPAAGEGWGAPPDGSAPVWPAPPVCGGDWQALTEAEATARLARVEAAFGPGAFLRGLRARPVLGLRAFAPASHPGAETVEILLGPEGDGAGAAPVSALFLLGADGAVLLTGQSAPLHAFNPGRIDLGTEAAARDYARLFCGVVQGEEGPFRLIEGPEDLRGLALPGAAAMPETALADLGGPALARAEDGAAWEVRSHVLYGDQLFRAVFRIPADGMIEMVEDEEAAAGLPVIRAAIRDGLRRVLPAAPAPG